jgi:hypothetical protein
LEQRPDRDLEQRPDRRVRRRSDTDDFWDDLGIDVAGMSPKAQIVTSLAVLVPVAVGAVVVLTLVTWLWWLIFVFGWAVFPGFSLLLRGIAGLSEGEGRKELRGSGGKERELLGALREHEEISPTQAAMETSLTVEEADNMLKELAAKGHLDVRVRGGGIFYGLWRAEDAEKRELEEGL